MLNLIIIGGVLVEVVDSYLLIVFVLLFVLIFFFVWIVVVWYWFVLFEEYL